MLPSENPTVKALQTAEPLLWRNPKISPFAQAMADVGLTLADVEAAAARLQRFAPYLAAAFPETAPAHGIIESPLYPAPNLQTALGLQQPLYLKADNELPVSGSIKARGGIYEVLCQAEKIALQHGLITLDSHYTTLLSPEAKQVFSQYRIAVGSTGNLGLSIGIMAAKLGFQTDVHMSADARAWKKSKLRACGVTVHEYSGDYGLAVAQGRKLAEADPHCHFVDDEHSRELFLGYAVGGLRLKQQLAQAGVAVSAEKPLVVYLPCGVGGGPGGVAFGLKLAFGDNVRCVFAEPVQSPCMLLGLCTDLHDKISVQDIGLSNQTAADGLAVGRASGFVGRAMQRSIEAIYTVADHYLYQLAALTHHTEQRKLEPSAAAGLAGPTYFDTENITHLAWATGGSMIPEAEFAQYLAKGKAV